MASDFRFALRTLRRSPGFALIAILTLALGVGANVAFFSVFERVLLRPLPYADAQRLVAIQEAGSIMKRFGPTLPVTAWHFREWRKQNRSFDGLALVGGVQYTLTGEGAPEAIPGGRVSASLFPILGIQAALGRTFQEDEDRPGHDHVVVLSHALWERRFHADPAIIGRNITLNGAAYQVIGVLPKNVEVPEPGRLMPFGGSGVSEFWRPFAISDDDLAILAEFNFGCIGKLKPGVSIAQGTADLDVIQSQIAKQVPDKVELRAVLIPLQRQITGTARASLTLLLGASAAVLLIVVVNLANLLLARSTARQRELAIRAAIGAGTGRLVRQTLAESLLLAAVGGALGVMLAKWVLLAVLLRAPLDLAGAQQLSLDGWALVLAAVVTVASGVIFGILPAWRVARTDPQAALRSGGRAATDSAAGGRARRIMIAAEVALSAMCLMGAGLLLNSLVRLLHVDKGFETEQALTTAFGLPDARYPDSPQRVAFVRRMLERVQSAPGVIAAGISNRGPLSGEGSNLDIDVEGANLPPTQRPVADYRCVTPGFFRAMGIPLMSGRLFDENDGERPVALVSAQTARKLWPGEDPIGRHFRLGKGDQPPITVVGIVGDIRTSLQKPANLTVYVPFWQRTRGNIALVVRTAAAPSAVAGELRAALQKLDPDLVVPRLRTLDEVVDRSVASRRFQMDLVMAFAGMALLLAALGVYGVVAQAVTQRTGEIGIRMALGATRGQVRGLVARQGMAPVAVGLAIGIAGSLAAGRLLEGMLFGVKATDPATILAVALTLLVVAAVACWAPVERAARLDPVKALRWE